MTAARVAGLFVATAIGWLALVEGQRPSRWDLLGGAVSVLGMAIIVLGGLRSR